MIRSTIYLLTCYIFLFFNPLFAQFGNLDNTFSGDGRVIEPIGSEGGVECDIAIQSDGRIVVAGTDFSTGISPLLFRYNADGTKDLSFNPDLSSISELAEVKISSSGKILVVGDASGDYFMRSYNQDGSIDFTVQRDFSGSLGNVDGEDLIPSA